MRKETPEELPGEEADVLVLLQGTEYSTTGRNNRELEFSSCRKKGPRNQSCLTRMGFWTSGEHWILPSGLDASQTWILKRARQSCSGPSGERFKAVLGINWGHDWWGSVGWAAGSVPFRECVRGNRSTFLSHINMSPSLSPSLPLSLKINK